jgi:hypothetical protein
VSLTYPEAKARLVEMVRSADEPVLDDASLEDLMRLAAMVDRWGTAPDHYKVWKASTAYAVGAFVVPTLRGATSPKSASSVYFPYPQLPIAAAVVWRVSVAGTSSGTEPVWPTSPVLGTTTRTDASVTWIADSITPWMGSWNLNLAAAEGWRRKAGKVANVFNIDDAGKKADLSQLLEHCLTMSKEYSRKTVASLKMRRADYLPNDYGRLIPGVESNWDDA